MKIEVRLGCEKKLISRNGKGSDDWEYYGLTSLSIAMND